MEKFKVNPLAITSWQKIAFSLSLKGDICICGHPIKSHDQMCQLGHDVCVCTSPTPVASVDDIRFFFRSTKGPHEAHALILGINELVRNELQWRVIGSWTCAKPHCLNGSPALPVRVRRDYTPTLKVTVGDKHVMYCEACLYAMLR